MDTRRKHRVGMLALAGFVGAVVAGAYSLVAGGFGGGCENEVVAEVASPRGGHRAVVFGRSCGATTGFSTQVSVIPARGHLSGSGNVFVADTDHGVAPEGPGGGPAVEVAWSGEGRLVIRHHPKARVFRAEERIGRVRITYEQR